MAAEAVLLKSFRERIAGHLAGTATLYPVKYLAYGDGGHDSDLNPISPSEDATALQHEVRRKEVASVRQEDPLSVTGKGTIENNRDDLLPACFYLASFIDSSIDIRFFDSYTSHLINICLGINKIFKRKHVILRITAVSCYNKKPNQFSFQNHSGF